MTPDAESMKMLAEARAKAERLLGELMHQQAELDARPPDIEPQVLSIGREAMNRAIAAAQRTLVNLDQALQFASTSSN
jgi:hypothetical protein